MSKLCQRFSKYKLMWILVMFDLPVETKAQRKAAREYRKLLLADGFTMFQYSIYVRNCASLERCDVHMNRITAQIPEHGDVCIITITDRQFERIKIFHGIEKAKPLAPAIQLELF